MSHQLFLRIPQPLAKGIQLILIAQLRTVMLLPPEMMIQMIQIPQAMGLLKAKAGLPQRSQTGKLR